MGEEHAPGGEHLRVGAVERDPHDRALRDPLGSVGLADRQEAAVLPGQPAVPDIAARGGQRTRRAARGQRIDALVGLLDVEQVAGVGRGPRASAVFVHRRAGVAGGGQQRLDRPVRAPPSHGDASALARNGLAPPDVVADDARAVQPRRGLRHRLGRQGRGPGSVGELLRHGIHPTDRVGHAAPCLRRRAAVAVRRGATAARAPTGETPADGLSRRRPAVSRRAAPPSRG